MFWNVFLFVVCDGKKLNNNNIKKKNKNNGWGSTYYI